MDIEELGRQIIGAAIEVHKELGPGLLESTYEHCLVHELKSQGIHSVRQCSQTIKYKGLQLDEGYRLDLLVENAIVVELKAVKSVEQIHIAQLLTYLKLSNKTLGFLINFNVLKLRDGIKRVVHHHKTSENA